MPSNEPRNKTWLKEKLDNLQGEWDALDKEKQGEIEDSCDYYWSIPTLADYFKPIIRKPNQGYYGASLLLTAILAFWFECTDPGEYESKEEYEAKNRERKEIIMKRADVIMNQFRYDLLLVAMANDLEGGALNKNLFLGHLRNRGIKTVTGKQPTASLLDKELHVLVTEAYLGVEEQEYSTSGGEQKLNVYHIYWLGVQVIAEYLDLFQNKKNAQLIDDIIKVCRGGKKGSF